MFPRLSALCAAIALFVTGSVQALDVPGKFRAEYRLSYLGFKVAESSFVSTFSGDRFVMEGTLRSAGLAALFDRTVGTTRVSGRLGVNRIEPVEYVLNYQSGSKNQLTAIRFKEGNVVETENDPPLKKRGPDFVPLGAQDLSAVFDPLTASMIRAATPSAVCDRTLRTYDGEMRVDLKLEFVAIRPFSTRGFKGDAVHCRARFEPVAGYRVGRRALDFLKSRSRIEIAFARVAETDIFAPVKATIGTEIGPLRFYATRFGPDG